MTTEILGAPLAEYLALEIPRVAGGAHRQFPRIDVEDFEQEMWEATLGDPLHYRELWTKGRRDAIYRELRRACTAYGTEDERDFLARKALAAGYSAATDLEFYTRRVVAAALEVLIDGEWDIPAIIERSSSGTDNAGVKIHGGSSPDATSDYMTVLVDVKRAFEGFKDSAGKRHGLTAGQRNTLTVYYGLNQDDTDAGRWERSSRASSMGLTLHAFQKRAYRALDALIIQLGGRSPYIRRVQRRTPRKAA